MNGSSRASLFGIGVRDISDAYGWRAALQAARRFAVPRDRSGNGGDPDHAAALGREAPTADARSFWGVMGCGCWAV